LTFGNTGVYYPTMVVKTVKLPPALDARIRRAAQAKKRTYSAVMRDAIARGLETSDGIDMAQALSGFIGAGEGPGDLSTNKDYFRGIGRRRAR
jgi:predicted transcriptional regulator